MSSTTAFEVPIQHYAGPLLIIKNLLQPKPFEPGTRGSYFDRCVVGKKMAKQMSQGEGCKGDKISMYGYDTVVDGVLAGLEAYMKSIIQKVVEMCEHRCGYKLYMNKRFVQKNDVRTTMTFLNDLELADYGSSDDDESFYRNIAELEDRRERRKCKERRESKSPKESKAPKAHQAEKATVRVMKASADSIAMSAFGSRKRPAAKPSGTSNSDVVPNPLCNGPRGVAMAPRFKHITIRDVLAVLEEDEHYNRSNMLYDAYMKYTT